MANHRRLFTCDLALEQFYSNFARRRHCSRQRLQQTIPHLFSQYPALPPLPPQKKATARYAVSNVASAPKESVTSGTKRRRGPGELNKVWGVSPELQAIVGQPAMPRTEIVKQVWVYIRKHNLHNLQDPHNKRKIICDDALQAVFETDCTSMSKMNKLLSKHITALDPSKQAEQAGQAKKLKAEADSVAAKVEQPGPSTVTIFDSLAKFPEVKKKRCFEQRL